MHPVLLQFSGVTIYTYGFCVATAVAVAMLLCYRYAPKQGLSSSPAMDLLFVAFVSGMIGSRLWYVIQHGSDFSADPISILWFHQGGLVWYGGFLGSLAGGIIYARVKKLNVWRWADFFAPIVPLAHGIGRVGCFFNGCCYGRFLGGLPVQLAEAGCLVFLSLCLFYLSLRRRFDGQIAGIYLIGYAVLRFGIEFFREDQVRHMRWTFAQMTSVVLMAAGAWMMVILSRRAQR